jgi:peptide/nickel transport system permease protein
MAIDVSTPPQEEQQKQRVPLGVRLKTAGKPIHVNIISIGAFVLISGLVIYGIDMGLSVLMDWLGRSVIAFDVPTTIAFSTAVRIIGVLGKPLYEKRPAEIVFAILKMSIVLLLLFASSIGSAIIVAFILFFWDPKRLVDWDDRRMLFYRLAVVGTVGVLMLLETMLTVDVVGFDPLPPMATASIGSLLAHTGLSWIAGVAAFVVLPLYIFIPRIIMVAWGMRKGIEDFWVEFVHDRLGLLGFFIVCAIVILAVFAPWIAPYNWAYTSPNPADWFLPPSLAHPFGTNHEGGDIFSRVIWGSQVSLLVGFTASIVAVVIGTLVGLMSGYYGGALDSVLMRITDLFLCLPTLPLMLIFLMFFGQGLQNVIIVIAILGWTGTARMVRSEALSLKERPLTEAAHAIGASDTYILFRHIMPNTLPLILANVIIGVVSAILGEAGISFLGFMPIHGQPSWGIVLYWASRKAALVNEMWWWIVPPGLMIMLTTVGFAFLSHAADKVVNPRLRVRRT